MNLKGITSLTKILSKNSEMQLPERTLYKVLAFIAVSLIMIPCTVIVGFISYVMTEALLEVDNPGRAYSSGAAGRATTAPGWARPSP